MSSSKDRLTGGGRTGGVAASSPLFRRLEERVRRVHVFLFLLVGVIVLVPGSVFFMLELDHLRADAESYARDCAVQVTSEVGKSSALDIGRLSALLEMQMRAHQSIAFVRLLGPEGEELVRLGERSDSFLPTTKAVSLPASAAPLTEIEVEVDTRALPPRLARVFMIHLLMAALFGLATYLLPVRALHRAIDNLKTTQAQLLHSDKLSAIGEIYAGLAHEINNPLSIILTRVKLLLGSSGEERAPPELIRDLEMIERHGTRIAEVVRGLLAFARKTTFKLVETDLNRVIEEVVSLVEKPFSKQGIRIQSVLGPSLPPLEASPDHLQQVFLNLLNNARDALPDGGTIKLRTLREGRHLVAEVEDDGTGIAEALQGRVFEPFFTTKGEGKGTG
ncbi:MAG: sensor histidine kinase, partial [Acidobacteriota bacterium]